MSSTKARTRRNPQERSAEILAAARDLALEGGLTALTSRAIAQRVGVASGLVAHYYAMDQLVADAFSHIVASEVDEVTVLVAAPTTPTERMALLLATLMDGSRHDVTLVWVEAWALGRRNDALAAAIGMQMDSWHDLVRAIIDQGTAAGEFRVDDAGLAGWQLLGMIDGLAAHSLVRGAALSVYEDQLVRAGEVLLGAPARALSAAIARG